MTSGLVVMAYGTPASPADIEPYYTHIRRGRPPSPAALAELTGRYQAIGGTSPLAELTAREREVLGEMAEGKSNAAIAESLVLTKRAVEKHVGAIFQKLGLEDDEVVSRRVTAVLLYLSEAGT